MSAADMLPRSWKYIQTHGGRELRLFSNRSDSAGIEHCLRINARGQMRSFDLDDDAIHALARAVAAFDSGERGEFAINKSLSLRSDPPGFVLANCEVSYRFAALIHLKALWERIFELRALAQLFG